MITAKKHSRQILLLLLSLALTACVSTSDDSQTDASSKQNEQNNRPSNAISIQGFNNVIAFSIPKDWDTSEPAYQASNGKQAILEFVPSGQTVEDWSEFLSLNAFASLPPEATPTGYFERMYLATENGGCQGERIFKPMIKGKINGYDSASIIFGCPDIPGNNPARKSELGYMIAIEGDNKDYYTIYRAMRGASIEELSKRLNEENYQAFIKDIMPIGIRKTPANTQ